MKRNLKIKDVLNLTDGFFATIDNPIWDNIVSSFDLDMELILNEGERYIAPILAHFVDDDDEISQQDLETVAMLVYNKFKDKWSRLILLEQAEYDPLENYSMTERETIDRDVATSGLENVDRSATSDITQTGTGTITDAHTGTDTNVRTGAINGTASNTETRNLATTNDRSETESDDTDTSNTRNNNVNGFGQNASVPESSQTETGSNDRDRSLTVDEDGTETGTVGNSGNTSQTFNNLTDTETRNLTDLTTRNTSDVTDRDDTESIDTTKSGTEEEDVLRTLSRSGNIGTLTNTKMWLEDWNGHIDRKTLEDVILEDALSVITLKIWESEV